MHRGSVCSFQSGGKAMLVSLNTNNLHWTAFPPGSYFYADLTRATEKPGAWLRVQAVGGGGSLLQDREVRAGAGTLTTGLARAELALEDARELELRWPPCSEGCRTAGDRRADRNKGTESAEMLQGQRVPPSRQVLR